MRFFKYLVFAAPLALATPAPNPVAAPDGGLLSQLPDMLNAVKELLNPDTLDNLQVIVKGGAVLLGGDTPKNLQRLVSSQNIDKLQHVIDNAETLLTPKFVNETTSLIDDAAPLVDNVSKLLGGLLGALV
ncbi:hypothetical protein ETB97_004991 [Aspergillus alliaceus]|uniref:Hydrophobic surface binding protein A-domain-containing protein n=1 Tax=Petromyces alliaceus TaxID=209559 RepID=A0A5N6FVJ5_PETAA|nr:uncharacterized protein BDW43DRAFT_311968 [Aspergillus alliaceus]KAB8232583.1 hypothetical protein BDW43DRAFT_311968 [Aspergillus alliaceus]KAE8394840.1 hypothetical protein BDV23DRAFT_195740 [Aspergillus alliaceus]KAF5857992.1 hypothetical protein ETB97_004991 [Aspergillus burnettii]